MALDLTIALQPASGLTYIQGADVTVLVSVTGDPDPEVAVLVRDPEQVVWTPDVTPQGSGVFAAVISTGLASDGQWLVEARVEVSGDEARGQQWFKTLPSVGPGVFSDAIDGGSALTVGDQLIDGGGA